MTRVLKLAGSALALVSVGLVLLFVVALEEHPAGPASADRVVGDPAFEAQAAAASLAVGVV